MLGFYIFDSMKKLLLLISIVALASCNSGKTKPDNTTKTTAQPQKQQQYRGFLDSLSQFIEYNPNNMDALMNRADYFVASRNYRSALNDFNVGIMKDSSFARIYEIRGEMYYRQGKSRRSKDDWEKCAKLDKDNIKCRLNLSQLYIAVKNYDISLKFANEVLELDPYNSDAAIYKGLILRDFYKDTTFALQFFQRAIENDQSNIQALDIMAVTLAERGDTLAPYYYQRIINIDPKRGDVYYKLGIYHTAQGEINKAIESYTKATQINPFDAESHFNLGYIHIELKQYSSAKEHFTQAINSKEGNYKAYYGRGYCFEVLGDVINAKVDYENAIEYLPNYQPARAALARVNQTINR